MPEPVVRIATRPGRTVATGGLRVTPLVRLLQVRLPGCPQRALVWSWPAAVEVERDGGAVDVQPVQDTTRLVLTLLILGGALVAVLGVWLRRPWR